MEKPFKCPACGYSEVHGNSKITNHMSEYIDKATGEVDGVFASVDPQLTVKDKVLVRKDLWVKPTVHVPTVEEVKAAGYTPEAAVKIVAEVKAQAQQPVAQVVQTPPKPEVKSPPVTK